MVSHHPHNNGWRIHFYFRGKRQKVWIGKCTKTQAARIGVHFEALKIAAQSGAELPRATQDWLSQIGPKLRQQIAKAGLLGISDAPCQLSEFCDYYFETRSDWAKSTRQRWQNTKKHLCAHFDEHRHVASVTEADAESFARWARSHFKSQSHSGKIIADCRQIFAVAKKFRLIHANPFHDGIKASQPVDESRNAYVSEEDVDKLIASATTEFAAVIASARYGGVRIPSEVLSMRWTDIDWSEKRIVIHDKKRKRDKVLPLFPKWDAALSKLWQESPEGQEHVFSWCRASANKTYRVALEELIQRNKLVQWPKLWVTMRASRETDLKAMFPGAHHVVHDWIGNSRKVSEKHYDRITLDHFKKALT